MNEKLREAKIFNFKQLTDFLKSELEIAHRKVDRLQEEIKDVHKEIEELIDGKDKKAK